MTITNKEAADLPQEIDNTPIIFESIGVSSLSKPAHPKKWDLTTVSETEAGELPVVGAQIGYGEHESVAVAQENLPQSSETGYKFQLLESKGDLPTFYRYPILLTTREYESSSQIPDEGVVVWMTVMETAALLPKVPIRIIQSKLKELQQNMEALQSDASAFYQRVNLQTVGDVFNTGAPTSFVPNNLQPEAYDIYSRKLDAVRLAYGFWIRAVEEDDLQQVELVKDTLLKSLNVASLFSGEHSLSSLSTILRIPHSQNKFFDIPNNGLLAELMGYELVVALRNILENSERSGMNALDERSVVWLSGIFSYLVETLLVAVPKERALFMLTPLWKSMESKLGELGLGEAFKKIKTEFGTKSPILAEAVTGESFL
ncbi:MAG: hypothetical protein BroJett025_08600 [Patescibacteria group bacterium]|nr:MAG: hypothetical protein BroJett025_08600 [Patescibacteria group bacterium]